MNRWNSIAIKRWFAENMLEPGGVNTTNFNYSAENVLEKLKKFRLEPITSHVQKHGNNSNA